MHPCAIEVMAEEGIDIASQRAKSVNEFDDMSFDYVVTLCADNQENCPIFPGGETYLQHAFPDPVSRVRRNRPVDVFGARETRSRHGSRRHSVKSSRGIVPGASYSTRDGYGRATVESGKSYVRR
jgi:hypothetical protein